MEPEKNFFFIDDSGSRQWETPYSPTFIDSPPPRDEENINFWRRNYFVLAGIHITQAKADELNKLINTKKIEVFGTKHVEIKSDNLRNPHQQKKFYLDPFAISQEDLRSFVDDFWYPLFVPENLTVQGFVLDKRYFAGKRGQSSPLALLSQIVFDRLVMFPADECVVVFDQMENDIKSTRNDHGEIIKVSDQTINASPFNSQYSHSEVRFEKSSNSNFLQLADTAAYNIYRQFVSYGDQWEHPSTTQLDTYEYLDRITDCLYCNDHGVIAGYGIVKYPNPTKRRWGKS